MLVCTQSSRLSSTSQVGKRRSVSVEPDPAFEPRQRGPDAEVRAVPEREVPVDHAPHVEAVGILEVAFVAVARAVEQRELEPRGMTVPCSSTSRATQRAWIGDGAS